MQSSSLQGGVRGGYKKTTFKYPAPWGGDHLFASQASLFLLKAKKTSQPSEPPPSYLHWLLKLGYPG
jgi:hypothetical protein